MMADPLRSFRSRNVGLVPAAGAVVGLLIGLDVVASPCLFMYEVSTLQASVRSRGGA